MPAGLGLNNVALRNFVKEFVHKITCGSSLEKTAVINGEVFDANSATFTPGGVVQNGITSADQFMPATIDVGVLGVTTTVDAMPNNTPGTFRVNDTTGIRNGSVVHVIDSAGNVGQALINHVHRSKSITVQNWVVAAGAALPPGSIVVASASGSPSPAMVDTDTSSSAGASAASGQYVAAMLRSMEDLTVSGLGGAAITTVQGGASTTVIQVGALVTQNFAVANTMIGNTITFDDVVGTQALLRGVSRTITANNAVDQITVFPALPVAPIVGDTFVLTATQLDGFLNQLMASPGNSGRALVGGLPIGAATEGPNDGAPANNSNVAPPAALAYAAAMRFGMLLTNNGLAGIAEPNLLLQDQILADLRGAEMPSSFPNVPLVTGVGAAVVPTALTITLPANVGDRATPRSGTFRIQQDVTTAGAPNLLIHPALNLGGIPFTRTGNVLTFTGPAWGAALGIAVLPGARVFLMTGAMNGPRKHGYASELASADFLNVLAGVLNNMLGYVIPSI